MALLATEARDHIAHTLSGELDGRITPETIINEAGMFLTTAHRWKWLEHRSTFVGVRAKITLTGATWTESSLTITKTGAFADYTFVEGDTVEITGGTGATTGMYIIASRTDDDDIVLKSSIGSAANGQADIAGTMRNWTASLPSDFGELLTYEATDSLVNRLNMTSMAQILSFRTSQIEVTSWNFWAAINHAIPNSGGAPVPVLEYWPEQSTTDNDALSITYRAKWVEVTTDTGYISIPDYCNQLYLQLLRATARGYEEEDVGTMNMRYGEIMSGPVFGAAALQDGLIQVDYGPMTGGAVQAMPKGVNEYLRTQVAGPS